MSRFRRIGIAATAAAAVLALAVAPGASAISINTTGPSAMYDVTGIGYGVTFFTMPAAGTGGSTGVTCYNRDNGMPVKYGWGVAQGQEQTLFIPPFQQPAPTGGWGCWFVDADGEGSKVSVNVTGGTLLLALTGLAPGQNPSSPRRNYNGKLSFYQHTRMSFAPAKYPGCSVAIVGPQSVDLAGMPWAEIVVDDDTDQIDMDVTGATFAVTKTAACPATIGDSMTIYQAYGGWRLNDVTVTP